jgi:glycosyltransferase involved in cell wall biosynthesis
MTDPMFNKKYAIITHKLFSGAGQELYRFLKQHNSEYVLLIEHNFSSSPNRKTIISEYSTDKEQTRESKDYRFLPDPIVYIKDFLIGFFVILSSPSKFDLIVGCGGFNAFCALLLKKMGKTQKVVFYTIDYVPKRFDNPILNKIYHLIDKICVKHCDQVWNLSPRMAEGRELYDNMPRSTYSNQRVIPIGVWLEDLPEPEKKYTKRTIVFVGHLLEKQGVQLVISSLTEIIKKFPDIQFLIIGTGNYEKTLKDLVENLGISQYVDFCGPIYNSKKLYETLSKCHLAVAIYNDVDSFTYFADPTKLKTYLSAGLPVLTSNVPYNACDLENGKCGVIVEYEVNSIERAITELLLDDTKLNDYSINAKRYIQKFDWNIIFYDAMKDI